jgi:hypothetical protein
LGDRRQRPNQIWKNKRYILCAANVITRIVGFYLLKDLTAKSYADVVFRQLICCYGSPVAIESDRGGNFNSQVASELQMLGSHTHRVVSSFHPCASKAERIAVQPFSSSLRVIMATHPIGKCPDFLSYVTFLVNSSYQSKRLSLTPFEIIGNGITSSFESPLLEVGVAQRSKVSKFWKDKMSIMARITEILLTEYKMALKLTRSYHTVHSMPVEIGDTIYFCIFRLSPRLAYLSTIMPRWKLGEVTKILGRTSIVIRDLETDRLISRHLFDVRLHKIPRSYLNLYNSSGIAAEQKQEDSPAENGEDFGGTSAVKIMLQQEQTAMRAAADQVEGEIEGKEKASHTLRRSNRLANKSQDETKLLDLSLAKKHTVDEAVPSNSSAVEAKSSINEEEIPSTKSIWTDTSVWPKQKKPSNQASKEIPELQKPLRRSARISKKLETGKGHEEGMPVGTASGNPCDNALEEFNLT